MKEKELKEKDTLVRFGVSMPDELMKQFDEKITKQGYTNRSEAIRDLVRKSLLDTDWTKLDQVVAGTIVMVYDHHISHLPLYLMELQHDFHHEIISTMHVHLNHDQCLEILVVKGPLQQLRKLHQMIQIQKGVAYAELSVTHLDGVERD
ncbi:nickel-responsive transcriptional regulator NikR [Ammoniphilus resinae]|uniref:Putative nickel-responsive regulator n=1 Tax=Ammoniphilus resinae TaxID=861532 RepID=A0ABS4GLT6_9BACL|nr:nickel-responsive transcriptional regulator NikR [Ammoniphilus resinae]MBP1931228.1 CopG family nickel-responsive transcriptional regulator [Ammoniphilus resinae]